MSTQENNSPEVETNNLKSTLDKEEIKPMMIGTFIFPSGDHYEGSFAFTDDTSIMRHGPGIHTTSNGDQYRGNWVTDNLNGPAIITYSNGSQFVGEVKDNRYHGKGEYKFEDGTTLNGVWENNGLYGEALLNWRDNQWLGSFQGHSSRQMKPRLVI